VFGTVLGLLTAAMGSAMALGNVLLALIQRQGFGFNGYLWFAAVAAFIGSSLFLLLGTRRFEPLPQS